MSQRSLKKLLPAIFLIGMLLAISAELKNNIKLIKTEHAVNKPDNTVQDYMSKEEADKLVMKEIDTLKKLARENERRRNNIFWKSIERKDSYNNELQYYSKNNVVIKDAAIEIVSKKENMGNKMYTSGLVESINAYRLGYFEFTIDISEGRGIFPAIWFLSDNGSALPEIDLFEMIGSEPYTFYGVNHFLKDDVKKSIHFEFKAKPKDQYTVAIDWKSESLTWYIDNQEIYSTEQGVPQEFMYIIINQAIGGDWPGNPDDMIFPASFKILSSKIEPVLKKGRN